MSLAARQTLMARFLTEPEIHLLRRGGQRLRFPSTEGKSRHLRTERLARR